MRKEIWKEYKRFRSCNMPESTDIIIMVSSIGRVKRLEYKRWNKKNNCYLTIKERFYVPQSNRGKRDSIETENKFGRYLHVNIPSSKGSKPVSIHRLVAITFIPNPENKPQVNHINGLKYDNRVENLEWVTNNENAKHAKENLRTSRKHLNFSEEDKKIAVELFDDGYNCGEIAEMLEIKTNRQSVSEVIAIEKNIDNIEKEANIKSGLTITLKHNLKMDSTGIKVLKSGKIKYTLRERENICEYFDTIEDAINFKKAVLKLLGIKRFIDRINDISIETVKKELEIEDK